MSKAFTKEDDAPVVPLVAPRAPLPPGVPNYVTPRGLERLRAERRTLDAERASLEASSDDGARASGLSAWSQRASELDQRIASAVCIDPESQPKDTVRFGSRVTVSDEEGHEQTYEIVGVDEAEPQAGRINFLSPLARALLGAGVGDEVTVRTPAKPKKLEVIAIA